MKRRNIPCTECRKHRRKCVRTSSTAQCSRCERLGKTCQQPTREHVEDQEEYSAHELENQIEELEWTIQQLEIEMKTIRSNNSLVPCKTTYTGIPTALLQSLIFNWKCQIKNGTFRIDTGIRNISDLLQLQPNKINYLSPLSSFSTMSSSSSSVISFEETEIYRGAESGLILQFGQIGKEGSEIPFTVRILTQCAKQNYERPASLLLPSNLLLDSAEMINQLLDIFFQCHNIYSPVLHEKTFRDRYQYVQDPLKDLICLCVCAYVCSTPCEHLLYGPLERRNMADYFFAKAKSMILDQFDDPEKRLENVMAINMLSRYMHIMLKFKECRKFIIMSHQICMDLSKDFRKAHSSTACIANQSHSNPETHLFPALPPSPPDKEAIEEMLFSRHVTITLCLRRLMDYVANELVDESCFHLPRWLYLEDEPEVTKRFIHAQNSVIGLFNHPFVSSFMKEIHKVHMGLVCTLSFESIVRMEDVIREWTGSIVPQELRLYNDVRDITSSKTAIDKEKDCVILVAFIGFHAFTMGIYTCLLQPKVLGNSGDQLLSFVQQHSLQVSLASCRLLIYAVKRISKVEGSDSCQFSLACSDYLFKAIDVLVLLSLSSNPYVAREARAIMKDCFQEITTMKFMKEHQVPADLSPIFQGALDLEDASTFNLEYYDRYPQPWFAMMFDASSYIASLSTS